MEQSSAPEDGRNYRPKQVELFEIINKPLLLHLVGYLYNCIRDDGHKNIPSANRLFSGIIMSSPYSPH